VPRENLTDRFIRTRKPASPGRRDDYLDAIVPGLSLRVTDKGHKSFVLIARFPSHPQNPTRRAIGNYGAISLEQARQRAREWLELVGGGRDPKIEEARRKAAEQRRHGNTFAAVAAEFLERHASGLAKKAEAKRIVEGEFVKRWGARPATDIMPEEVAAAIRAIVKRGAPYQAHNALGWIRTLFNWAIGTHEFGITSSPVERLKPKALIGERKARERILTDAELRAVWDAAEAMGYPYGPIFRLLILTGQREREIADMSWPEVDFAERLLTVPAERMKGGRAHEIPLTRLAVTLLEELPRWNAGNHVFSTTAGQKPVNGFSAAKARLDKLSGVSDFVIHDLRRTVRTHFSALPVEDIVRELVIAHAKPGLHKIYDKHSYCEEKRRCLTLWEKRLRGIVAPPSGENVVALQGRAASI
jgi:integrase